MARDHEPGSAAATLDEGAIRSRLREFSALVKRGELRAARIALRDLALVLDRAGRRARARKLRRVMFTLLEPRQGEPPPSTSDGAAREPR